MRTRGTEVAVGCPFEGEVSSSCETGKDVPFVYRLAPLNTERSVSDLYARYQSMCEELQITNEVAHSMLTTTSWLMLAPRTCANIQGTVPNAAMQGGANAMIGMEWMTTRVRLSLCH